jgi:hypothetical protein
LTAGDRSAPWVMPKLERESNDARGYAPRRVRRDRRETARSVYAPASDVVIAAPHRSAPARARDGKWSGRDGCVARSFLTRKPRDLAFFYKKKMDCEA